MNAAACHNPIADFVVLGDTVELQGVAYNGSDVTLVVVDPSAGL